MIVQNHQQDDHAANTIEWEVAYKTINGSGRVFDGNGSAAAPSKDGLANIGRNIPHSPRRTIARGEARAWGQKVWRSIPRPWLIVAVCGIFKSRDALMQLLHVAVARRASSVSTVNWSAYGIQAGHQRGDRDEGDQVSVSFTAIRRQTGSTSRLSTAS